MAKVERRRNAIPKELREPSKTDKKQAKLRRLLRAIPEGALIRGIRDDHLVFIDKGMAELAPMLFPL